MGLQSQLFRENPAGSKQFADDLATIAEAGIPSDVLPSLPGFVGQHYFAQTRKDESLALAQLREAWPVSEDVLEAVIDIGRFLLRRIGEQDTVDDVLADLPVVAPSIKNQTDSIRPFIATFLKEAQEHFRRRQRIFRTQESGLPVLAGLTHLADLRAVVGNEDDLTTGASEDYCPDIECLVPVAIIELRLHGDDPIAFQADRRSLDLLVRYLQGLQLELDALVKFVPQHLVHPGRTDI